MSQGTRVSQVRSLCFSGNRVWLAERFSLAERVSLARFRCALGGGVSLARFRCVSGDGVSLAERVGIGAQGGGEHGRDRGLRKILRHVPLYGPAHLD